MRGGTGPTRNIRAALARILASEYFRGSESLRRLLRYTVESTLAGKGDALKEYTIALEALGRQALGRPASFDPRNDNIVRVQARKLRQRLSAYYAGDGCHDSCRITYHPGTYKPDFSIAAPTQALPAVAVLPFMNMTSEEDAGYLCDGLAEEVIALLSRSEGLRVVGRTSSFQFKGLALDARDIGQRLGASLLIEGAVRGTRDRCLITVRLISCSDGCELWSERYDRRPADLLALETEIAASVASVLTAGAPPANTTTDNEALTLYLRARYAWNHRTESGFRKAVELYTAATRRDARAARAWAGLAECHVLMNMHGLAIPDVCMPKARQAAATAIEIDPNLAEAHSALAAVHVIYDRDAGSADEYWCTALDIDPDSATAHHWYAMFGLLPSSAISEATGAIRQAERLDPLSAPIANDVGFVLYWSRRFDSAIEQCSNALTLHPRFYRTHILLARALAAQGRYSEAYASCVKAEELSDGASFRPHLLGTLGFVHACRGEVGTARAIMDDLSSMERDCVTGHERGLIAVGLGDWEEAARSIERAYARRTGWAAWFGIEPLYDPLRERGYLANGRLG